MNNVVQKTLSILLVEDSVLDGRLLLEALRPAMNAGEVVVQTVKRLSQAIQELKNVRFSCVLLDLGLPDGSGTDNVRALREVDREAAIIVLTGLDDERSAAEALKLGAQDYLLKGETDGEQLMKLIRRAVQRNRQTWELEAHRDNTFFAASRDPLTTLPNRALFLDRARLQLAEARARDGEFGLALIQVDGLEEARVQYGAVVADELIQQLAKMLGETLRPSDSLARLDSSEFGLLLYPLTEPGALHQLAQQLVQRTRAVVSVGSCAVAPSLRVGLALRQVNGDSLEDLLETAKRAAASVNEVGGGVAGLEIEHAVARPSTPISIADGSELVALWQPWLDVDSGRCVGLELLPQSPFIDQAFFAPELTPSQAAVLVLATADHLGRQCKRWQQSAFQPEGCSLNVPAAALCERDFAARLRACLAAHELAPHQLQLEVAESAFHDLKLHGPGLHALHADGFRLVLDGDGSGDISLRQLVQVPLDGFKLSPGLVRLLMEESLQGASRRFITAVLGAAQSLGASVVATGVDRHETYAALRLIGLRFMQGRSLIPPSDADAVVGYWASPVLLR